MDATGKVQLSEPSGAAPLGVTLDQKAPIPSCLHKPEIIQKESIMSTFPEGRLHPWHIL